MLKHGHARSGAETSEYVAWLRMNQRCRDTSNRWYGGRGIRVEFGSFAEFFAHVGPKPSPKHSIDRIDGAGHYAPGNCRWATWEEQAANRRRPNARAV